MRIIIVAILIFNVIFVRGADAADWEKTAELRKSGKLNQAEQILKKYSSPADSEFLNPGEKLDFLRGLLELAHVRALKNDVTGSLSLLNWAEDRKDPYQRALSCVKYAGILLDMGEFERANSYLNNADEIIKTRAIEKADGAAIGQGGSAADTGAAWCDLREESDMLKAEVESEEMKKKYGATYGNYVKLRRLQVLLKRSRTPRYLNEAMRLADELIETDPASQFAAAAGYLKGEIMAARLGEKSSEQEIKEIKDYLNKFVRQHPDGLYRGEALMLLGKISLEIEWDAKEAEQYYSQALTWFRRAREKRDAVSLYAALNEDLKKQTMPTQKPTTLDQWKRIVYHEEDPLKLYNTANAPVWYMDNKEKECIYPLGLLAFANGKYEDAWKYWSQITQLDKEQREMDSANFPNVIMRLRAVCKQKEFLFPEQQRKAFSNKNKLKMLYAELLFYEEKFSLAEELFKNIFDDPRSNNSDKAAAYLGFTDSAMMLWTVGKTANERLSFFNKYPKKALELAEKTPLREYALRKCALFLSASTRTCAQSLPYYEQFLREYPKSRYTEGMILRVGVCYAQEENFEKAEQMLKKLKKDSYIKILTRTIEFKKGGKNE